MLLVLCKKLGSVSLLLLQRKEMLLSRWWIKGLLFYNLQLLQILFSKWNVAFLNDALFDVYFVIVNTCLIAHCGMLWLLSFLRDTTTELILVHLFSLSIMQGLRKHKVHISYFLSLLCIIPEIDNKLKELNYLCYHRDLSFTTV
jgi:hypothetical protein